MRVSKFFISTLKEAPSEAEVISHKLMLRAGLIKRLTSGVYTWMPLGLRVLRRVENIIREELNRSGAIELSMPAVQPAELWIESGRWEQYGPELLRIKDRHDRDFCFGPTHEEVISDVVRREVKSYRQLPLNFYQIQTKFRDEIRPRFGVMRGREFVMKDAYSFHTSYEDLQTTYREMYDCYSRIFTRLGLKFRAVAADTGSIGGTGSHEFHVLADSGEDALAYCPDSEYAANVELAEAVAPAAARPAAGTGADQSPHARRQNHRRPVHVPEIACRKNRQSRGGRRRRRQTRADDGTRRSRTESDQGRQTRCREKTAGVCLAGKHPRGLRRRPRLAGAGGLQRHGHCGSHRGRNGRLCHWRQ